jgi:hypothetical protein
MAGDDLALGVNQDRIIESKALDALGDQPDLLARVGPGIARVGREPIDRNQFDAVVAFLQKPSRACRRIVETLVILDSSTVTGFSLLKYKFHHITSFSLDHSNSRVNDRC